ncbi:ABC-type Fe3+ transport system, substrate-binding protein [Thalassospira xiamenensis M-5 = DSM 17429]|uniref:Ferric iron ABC transporter substrate-binding protein n=1 Tax=Thalassospira xiamenensis M-5 = DSM 17429 TaxID=1123366 RepID=A0AB72U7V4_9PROT|nr:ferric iron ABC transporter substrate-binding protein [Thalassospira xiamenensis M-5 = DSM 17429]SIT32749.1 ABC-type Fe3+ transport system, substrate-binding protein [Thalassospira xiamenensis M-5 = DSM 17429]
MRVVVQIAAGMLAFAISGKATACELSILTSYPSSFYKPFIDQFVKQSGTVDVCVQNKNTIGLIAHVRENRRPVPDIVWASSPVAFELLEQQGALAKFPEKVSEPVTNGGIQIDASDGSRFGFALSTIGMMSATDQPFGTTTVEIADLASPYYYGLLGMSSPSRSGTTHLFVESLLQQYGWQDGWALLSQIGGNLATVTARSFGVRDGVARKRFPFGIGIDFLARSEPQTGEALLFQAFSPGWYFPASVAVTGLGAQNARSLEFVDFLRGDIAQHLLLHPEIRRIPIDPKLWPQAGFSPSENNPAQGLDLKLAARRMAVVNALYDDMITHRLLELRKLWQSLRRLEATPVITQSDATKPLLNAVRDALESVPVAAFMANEHSFERVFSDGVPTENAVVGRLRLQDSWSNDFSQRFKSARELIARMDAFQSHLDTGAVK